MKRFSVRLYAMKWIGTTILMIIILIKFFRCSEFNRNDFILNKDLIKVDSSLMIGYKLYQVGIDNYRYEFFAKEELDTTKLFDTYLNDAIYTVVRFNTTIQKDTISIDCNINMGKHEAFFKNRLIKLRQQNLP